VVVVNLIGTKFVGRTELFVVTIELAILAALVVFGLTKAHPARFAEAGGEGWLGVLFAAGLLYVTYEGFGVVTNSAGGIRNPAKELPRAMFLALGIVIVVYILVSSIVVMTMSLPAIDANQGHVLSEAAQHILGRVGFVVIGVATLLATASGVNATMFGDANLAYMVSTTGCCRRISPASVARRHRRPVHRGGDHGRLRVVLPVGRGGPDGQPGFPARVRHGERRPSARPPGDRRQAKGLGARGGTEPGPVPVTAGLHDPPGRPALRSRCSRCWWAASCSRCSTVSAPAARWCSSRR
jgi:hypothetical protein